MSITCLGQSQNFDEFIQSNIKYAVPIIKVADIENLDNYTLLDSRERNEYETSHLPDAIHTGYDHFDINQTQKLVPNKSTPIIVYCSIGVRSELIGERLIKAGYTEVYNLYGGIFEWKNQSREVYNSNNEVTEEIHTFSKEFSKWLTNGTIIYDK